ncbi:uncharacterized protein MYCFIDRAFT_88155 [Pseudocercospora fijiensis CIRAD86]|uniref:Uncharacterized protein n=1 Tax=Pseudocercospora fijiensis (strain CIRAD86) TaxID=383855 RepID=M3AFN4_PSEFD|nr:uncharacterized protein MYCFIDRAFT_88155 [Pseudocercospora fijiensis CIRAD86]EME83406.1 hypothetical protein MYCFIDRAFT_88155 [Pseudocercospora fijiensis CIRAD86]
MASLMEPSLTHTFSTPGLHSAQMSSTLIAPNQDVQNHSVRTAMSMAVTLLGVAVPARLLVLATCCTMTTRTSFMTHLRDRAWTRTNAASSTMASPTTVPGQAVSSLDAFLEQQDMSKMPAVTCHAVSQPWIVRRIGRSMKDVILHLSWTQKDVGFFKRLLL